MNRAPGRLLRILDLAILATRWAFLIAFLLFCLLLGAHAIADGVRQVSAWW